VKEQATLLRRFELGLELQEAKEAESQGGNSLVRQKPSV
jgi:hypothetical protein